MKSAYVELYFLWIPPKGREEASDNAECPRHNHHNRRELGRHQTTVLEGDVNGEEAIKGHDEEAEDGYIDENMWHIVEYETDPGVSERDCVSDDDDRNCEEAFTDVRSGQTTQKTVADCLKLVFFVHYQQDESVDDNRHKTQQKVSQQVHSKG